MKNVLLRSLAMTLVLGLIIGCAPQFGALAQEDRTGGIQLPISEEPLTFTHFTNSHQVYAHKDDFLVYTELEKRTNVKLETTAVNTGFAEKKNVMLGSNKPADIMTLNLSDANNYGPMGVLEPVNKYIDTCMPNLKRLIEEDPTILSYNTAADGNMYVLPRLDYSKEPNVGLFVRKDILDKHNLAVPTTFDELYDLLLKFKELYPDSNPWSTRWESGAGSPSRCSFFVQMSTMWGTTFDFAYDTETNTWNHALYNAQTKKFYEWVNKCYAAGLFDPEMFSMKQAQYEQKLINDKTFFAVEYFIFKGVIEPKAKKVNPDFEYIPILPLKVEGGDQKVMVILDITVQCKAVSAAAKNKEDLFRYLDYWFYSPEGIELTNYGVEGVTFEREADGSYKFLPNVITGGNTTGDLDLRGDAGCGMEELRIVRDVGYFKAFNPAAVYSVQEQYAENGFCIKEFPTLVFSEEEQEIIQMKLDSLTEYYKAQLVSFISGARSFDEWDAFVKEMQDKGVDEILEIYNNVSKRMFE